MTEVLAQVQAIRDGLMDHLIMDSTLRTWREKYGDLPTADLRRMLDAAERDLKDPSKILSVLKARHPGEDDAIFLMGMALGERLIKKALQARGEL